MSNLLTAVLLPLALALVMLGMGLTLTPADFLRLLRRPRAVGLGLLCQMLVLPALTLLILRLVPMAPPIAVGLVVVALCPVGPASTLITYLARGDVALAVSLTALSSALAVLTIPPLTNQALHLILGTGTGVQLPIARTMLQICAITLLPTGLGMGIRHGLPRLARSLEPWVNRLATVLLALLILAVLLREGSKLPGFLLQAGIAVILLHGLGIAAGCLGSLLAGLTSPETIAVAVSVGLQNAALAIAITAGLLGDPEMAIPAALYGLLMYGSGVAMICCGRCAR
ncbi:MAG: bile acid:sodium symporter family protein [Synechococcaceae cyanobacterium]|nr:bile acid:sodium symporter family protein [Synechococcaceae cyanobacterium]